MAEGRVTEYPNCFGCGDSNPIGLRLKHRIEDDYLVTEFVPQEEHQGWPGIVHGGVISALLYEVLENFPYRRGTFVMMRSMETRYRRPASTGKRIVAKSWLVSRTERDIDVSAALTGEGGELIAEGKAVLVALGQEQIERLGLGPAQEETT